MLVIIISERILDNSKVFFFPMKKAEHLKNELIILLNMPDSTSNSNVQNSNIQETAQYQEIYINYIGEVFNEAVQWYNKAPKSDKNFQQIQELFNRISFIPKE